MYARVFREKLICLRNVQIHRKSFGENILNLMADFIFNDWNILCSFFLLNSYISYQFVLWILLQDERDDRSNILQCSLWFHSVENEERSFFHSQNAREIGGRLRSKFQPKTLFNYNKIRKYLFTCIHFILSLSRSLVFFSFYVLPPHLSQSWDKSSKSSKSNKKIFLLFHLECNAK